MLLHQHGTPLSLPSNTYKRRAQILPRFSLSPSLGRSPNATLLHFPSCAQTTAAGVRNTTKRKRERKRQYYVLLFRAAYVFFNDSVSSAYVGSPFVSP